MKLVGREFNSQEYIILFYFPFDFLESNWGSCSYIYTGTFLIPGR